MLNELNETGKRTIPEDALIEFVKGRWEKQETIPERGLAQQRSFFTVKDEVLDGLHEQSILLLYVKADEETFTLQENGHC